MHCMVTNKAQCHPRKNEGEAFEFLDIIQPILLENNQDLDFVINMD
jgi:hypothetical protein